MFRPSGGRRRTSSSSYQYIFRVLRQLSCVAGLAAIDHTHHGNVGYDGGLIELLLCLPLYLIKKFTATVPH